MRPAVYDDDVTSSTSLGNDVSSGTGPCRRKARSVGCWATRRPTSTANKEEDGIRRHAKPRPGPAVSVAPRDGGSLNTVTLAAPKDRHTVTRGRKGAVRVGWGAGAAQEGAGAKGQPEWVGTRLRGALKLHYPS